MFCLRLNKWVGTPHTHTRRERERARAFPSFFFRLTYRLKTTVKAPAGENGVVPRGWKCEGIVTLKTVPEEEGVDLLHEKKCEHILSQKTKGQGDVLYGYKWEGILRVENRAS